MKAIVRQRGLVRACLFFLLLAFLAPDSGFSAAYIKFKDVEGESDAAGYEGWSDLLSVQQTIVRTTDEQNPRGGPPKLEDISCTKIVDRSTPKLAEATATGLVFETVEIHFTRNGPSGQQPYLKYTLENVIISSYNLNENANSNLFSSEGVFLNFETITMTYTVYNGDGAPAGDVEFIYTKPSGA